MPQVGKPSPWIERDPLEGKELEERGLGVVLTPMESGWQGTIYREINGVRGY